MPGPQPRRAGASGVKQEERGEPLVGLEPTTARLRIECSTTELQWPINSEGAHACAPMSCPGADSNRDAFRHYPLKIACLPVSPPGRAAEQDSRRAEGGKPPATTPKRTYLDRERAVRDRRSAERDVHLEGADDARRPLRADRCRRPRRSRSAGRRPVHAHSDLTPTSAPIRFPSASARNTRILTGFPKVPSGTTAVGVVRIRRTGARRRW